MADSVSRRDFGRLFALGGSAALFGDRTWAQQASAAPALDARGAAAGEAFWQSVRGQFVMPPELAVMNAANLCPASRPAVEALTRETHSVDHDPSPNNRARLYPEKENTRKALAAFLRVTPDEIIITGTRASRTISCRTAWTSSPATRSSSTDDNHPSNLNAWREKAQAFWFHGRHRGAEEPAPGHGVLRRRILPRDHAARTKVMCFTHLSSTVGDLMPARELCRVARERGVLTLLDGAQSFGLLDVNLAEIAPDFYSGSAHKWPCGARECGVLYVRSSVQPRLWPSIYSAYPGATGFSRTFEGFGQRDEATMIAFRAALEFQDKVGRAAIEARARELSTQLIAGLTKLPGVKVWTSPEPELRAAVVSFQPAALDSGKLAAALYEKHKVAVATRGGQDRGGLRVSPHLYNSPAEIDRLLSGLGEYLKTGV